MNQQPNPWGQTQQPPQSQVPQQPLQQQPFPQQPFPQQSLVPGGYGPPPQQVQQPVPQAQPPQPVERVTHRTQRQPTLFPVHGSSEAAPQPQLQTQALPQQPMIAQPPVQVQQPALQQQEAQVAGGVLKDIIVLLREFAKREHCDRYAADGEKIKMLTDYLWLRQLTPSLRFETFLDLYAPVADFDEVNLKHPADAIKELLPRAKSQADRKGTRQWTASEVVGYLATYVDMIRAAEVGGVPIPLGLNAYLAAPTCQAAFFDNASKPEPKATSTPKVVTGGGTKTKKEKDEVPRPTATGQRAIMSHQNGRQYRGYVTKLWTDGEGTNARTYVDFKADSGEEFPGTAINKFELVADSPPQVPKDDTTNQPKPECGSKTLVIKKAEYAPAQQALALNEPVGTVTIGHNVYHWHQSFDDGHTAVLCVVNGEHKPYVDAFLCKDTPDNVVAELPPRDNLVGTYQFDAAHGVYTLEVRGNE